MIDYVVRSLREDELEDMLLLTSTSYNSSIDTFRRIYENDPFYSFDLTRVAEYEGRLIAYLRAAPRTMWIGSNTLRMGGIAEVCTLQEYRRMGIATHLLKDMIRLLVDRGYPVSMLYGRPGFYGRIGWERCCIVQRLQVHGMEIPAYAEAAFVRRFEEDDLPSVMSIYESTYGGRSCALVRNIIHWKGRILPRTRILVYDDGQVRGYLAYDQRKERANDHTKKILEIREGGYENDEVVRGLVGALSHFEDFDIIEYGGVEGDAMLTTLSVPGSTIWVGYDGMFRVNDVMGTLEGLVDEFQSFRGKLAIRIMDDVIEENNETFLVNSSRGEVKAVRGTKVHDRVEMDIRCFSQLVPGTFSAKQLGSAGKINYSSPGALALADKLFPRRFPIQPDLDHF